jgi:CHAD domain-containing protein
MHAGRLGRMMAAAHSGVSADYPAGPACGRLKPMRRPGSAEVAVYASGAAGSRLAWQALVEHQARLRSIAARLSAARADDVHDARVAARRLRSLLATCRPLFDQRRSQRLRRDLKDFARVLSGPRDADVRRSLLLAVAERVPAMAVADTRCLRAALRRECAESRRAMREALADVDWAGSVGILGDVRTLAALRLRLDVELAELLELVDRPWRDAGRMLASRPRGRAKLHRLRLMLKRCRYALESVSSLQPGRAGRVLDRLRSVQDSLGDYLDAVAARKWLKASGATLGRPLVHRLDHELKALEKELKGEALRPAAGLMPAYAQWRMALRGLRTG